MWPLIISTGAAVVMTVALYLLGFSADTGQMLTLFIPLVWGVMFALGGGLIFLRRYQYSEAMERYRPASRPVSNFMAVILVESLIFILLSTLYPMRGFFAHEFAAETFGKLGRLYDCIQLTAVLVPCASAVLAGAYCLFLAINQED